MIAASCVCRCILLHVAKKSNPKENFKDVVLTNDFMRVCSRCLNWFERFSNNMIVKKYSLSSVIDYIYVTVWRRAPVFLDIWEFLSPFFATMWNYYLKSKSTELYQKRNILCTNVKAVVQNVWWMFLVFQRDIFIVFEKVCVLKTLNFSVKFNTRNVNL